MVYPTPYLTKSKDVIDPFVSTVETFKTDPTPLPLITSYNSPALNFFPGLCIVTFDVVGRCLCLRIQIS